MTDVQDKKQTNQWRCGNCGMLLDAPAPPKMCPSCHTVCEFLNVTCYEPGCEAAGVDNRLK